MMVGPGWDVGGRRDWERWSGQPLRLPGGWGRGREPSRRRPRALAWLQGDGKFTPAITLLLPIMTVTLLSTYYFLRTMLSTSHILIHLTFTTMLEGGSLVPPFSSQVRELRHREVKPHARGDMLKVKPL